MKRSTRSILFITTAFALFNPMVFAQGSTSQNERQESSREILTEDLELYSGQSRTVTMPLKAGEILELQAFVRFDKVGGYTHAIRVFLDGQELTRALGREDSFEMADGRKVQNFQDYKGGWSVPITSSLALFAYDPGIYAPADSSFQPSKLRFPVWETYPEGAEIKIFAEFDAETFDQLVVKSIRAFDPFTENP